MSDRHMIKFVNEFTDMPIGRYRSDGQYSGEVFREDILLPALQQYPKVTLDLDGVYGFGSAFLDEAFAGILRNTDYTLDELNNRLEIICKDDPDTICQIYRYMENLEMRC